MTVELFSVTSGSIRRWALNHNLLYCILSSGTGKAGCLHQGAAIIWLRRVNISQNTQSQANCRANINKSTFYRQTIIYIYYVIHIHIYISTHTHIYIYKTKERERESEGSGAIGWLQQSSKNQRSLPIQRPRSFQGFDFCMFCHWHAKKVGTHGALVGWVVSGVSLNELFWSQIPTLPEKTPAVFVVVSFYQIAPWKLGIFF